MKAEDTLLQIQRQQTNEERFSRKFIDGYIREDVLSNPDVIEAIENGTQMVTEWMNQEYSYASKNARLAQLKLLDINELVTEIFVGIAYVQREELLSSVAAQLAGRLKFSDKVEAITTIAEILAVLCQTNAFDINKPGRLASLKLISRIPLTDKTKEYIAHSTYLPPMVCKPNELTNNYSSGYLTHSDSLILGKGTHHSGNICLDVLNLMNSVALKLDVEFLSTVEEEPTHELDTQEKMDLWMAFKKQSYYFYSLMIEQGNKFYLTHKVDSRGRIYACGYHITTQGTGFKKAMIELANEELVDGVPEHLKIKD